MLKIIIWTVLLFFVIRFIVRFVYPMIKISRIAREKLNQIQKQMDQMQNITDRPSPEPSAPKEGDYIEYEEVK